VARRAVHALQHISVLPVPDHGSWVFSATPPLTGLLGGLGYVALFGPIAATWRDVARPSDRSPPAVAAVGKRSLSAYLAQSVIFGPAAVCLGQGLGAFLGSAGAAALAIATWSATVPGCSPLERHGRRGPAEWLLRRLAYGRSAHC
jgi:uncharacterized membrane protein YeiB